MHRYYIVCNMYNVNEGLSIACIIVYHMYYVPYCLIHVHAIVPALYSPHFSAQRSFICTLRNQVMLLYTS